MFFLYFFTIARNLKDLPEFKFFKIAQKIQSTKLQHWHIKNNKWKLFSGKLHRDN